MTLLIETLIKQRLLTREQLQDAKDKQIGAKRPIHELLVEMGFIKEEDMIKASSKVFKMPILNLKKEFVDTSLTEIISYEMAKRYGVFPVRRENGVLVVAMSDPLDVIALDDIRTITEMDIKPILSTKSDISMNIEKYYHSDETLYDLLKNIVEDTKVEVIKEDKEFKEHLDLGMLNRKQSPVVTLVNLILSEAVKARASDIHIEPQKDSFSVRYRVDGNLKNIMKVPIKLYSFVVARIKIISDLDIAESRKPQDGRTMISVYGRNIDLRISMIPTYYGEKIVLRLLDTEEAKVQLDKLGFTESELNLFKEMINRPQGMILITGPTGSGKTSTICSSLNFIKSETKNIITIEDPIEYLVDGLNQIQINPVKGITFANGLRSILRQDPNVIFIGEIRDRETAEIAFKSSLTGHLVFSTLHTNNSISTITRLLDIGLEPYLISSSVVLIVAQRLVRVICSNCKEPHTPDKNLADKFRIYIGELNIKEFYKGRGCERCGFTGFFGRTAVFEILKINEKLRNLISKKSSEDLILKEAENSGLRLLVKSGIEKVSAGITTLEELARVIDVIERDKVHRTSLESKGNLKILVADDEEDILKVLEMRLNDAGYEVIKARNGKEAVKYAFKEKPDLIVMDVMMPDMDGFEATKILRSNLETAVIPILLLTAKKDNESELKGFDAGADDYVTKPYDENKLLARIKMLLRRKNITGRITS